MKLFLVLVMGTASSAFGAYTVQSRFSEVKRFNYDNLVPQQNEILGTTTGFQAFQVLSGQNPPYQYFQNSSLSAGGASYKGYTQGYSSSGPPAGSGWSGSYVVSKFQIAFNLDAAADFTLTGSLHRIWYGDVTLKLEPLSVGASATRLATALGSTANNFVATPVNWSGTLLAGQYRLSIEENATQGASGTFHTTDSTFTFSIPAPGALAAFGAFGMIAPRRRRLIRDAAI